MYVHMYVHLHDVHRYVCTSTCVDVYEHALIDICEERTMPRNVDSLKVLEVG